MPETMRNARSGPSIARADCTPPPSSTKRAACWSCAKTSDGTTRSTKSWDCALLERLVAVERHVLVVSGRSSFEIMQKALAGRIPIVAAVSAPSSLAVEFARENGQTLIGFLREGRMNIYCGHERLGCQPAVERVMRTEASCPTEAE